VVWQINKDENLSLVHLRDKDPLKQVAQFQSAILWSLWSLLDVMALIVSPYQQWVYVIECNFDTHPVVHTLQLQDPYVFALPVIEKVLENHLRLALKREPGGFGKRHTVRLQSCWDLSKVQLGARQMPALNLIHAVFVFRKLGCAVCSSIPV
jgi:hypothetical protein